MAYLTRRYKQNYKTPLKWTEPGFKPCRTCLGMFDPAEDFYRVKKPRKDGTIHTYIIPHCKECYSNYQTNRKKS